MVETVESNNQPDAVVSKQSWDNFLKRNKSIIVDLFAGQYKSTIVCPDCKRVSITFDPYLSVSLPIPSFNFITSNMYFIFRNSSKLPYKLNILLPSNATILELYEHLSEITKVSSKLMQVNMIKDHRIIEICNKTDDFKYLKEHEGITFIYEINDKLIDLNSEGQEPNIRTEINVYHEAASRSHSNEEREVSYTRIIYINRNTNREEFLFQVYKTFRPFLKGFFEMMGSSLKEQPVDINLDDWSNEILREEYSKFFPETSYQQSNKYTYLFIASFLLLLH